MSTDTDNTTVVQAREPAWYAMASQLDDWASDGLWATAYLSTGGVVASDSWEFSPTEELVFVTSDASGGVMFCVDPRTIVAVHWGKPSDNTDPYVRPLPALPRGLPSDTQ